MSDLDLNIKADLSATQPPSPGTYQAQVRRAQPFTSNSGLSMVAVDFTITGADDETQLGRDITAFYILENDKKYKISQKRFVEFASAALGISETDVAEAATSGDLNLGEAQNQIVEIKVAERTWQDKQTGEDKSRLDVVGVTPAA